MTEMGTLSEIKAQINKTTKKRNLTVSKATREKEKAAKKMVKVSTDTKAKPAKVSKPKAAPVPKVPFETYEAAIAKLVKVSLTEETRNGKKIKVGTNKNVRLESLPERKALIVKVNGKITGEIYPGKKGYKFCVKLNKELNIPKNATVKEHPTWKDIIVAEPNELVNQLMA